MENKTRVKSGVQTLVKASGLFFALALVATGCSDNKGGIGANTSGFTLGEIVNGTPVKATEDYASSTVALYVGLKAQNPGDPTVMNFCTGTLIAPDLVMTAAHCFVDFSHEANVPVDQLVKSMAVGFGLPVAKNPQPAGQSADQTIPNTNTETKAPTNVQFRTIANYAVHPDYVYNSVQQATKVAMHDVALIRLSSPAPTGARPAKLITDAAVLKKGLVVTLVGFGLLNRNPVTYATQMMEVKVTVAYPDLTSTQFAYNVVDGKASCSGDSGGPAYLTEADGSLGVIGVTSWGDTDCTKVGAYTSVPAMASWIQTEASQLH